jgi:predicted metal-binding membrane protein
MNVEPPGLERLLKRDRHIVIGGLVFVSVASWLYILTGAGMDMGEMASKSGGDVMAMKPAWTPAYFGLMLAMWWVMMVAMMLPSAAPMLLLFARVNRKDKAAGSPLMPTGAFATGYLIAWGGFSVLAAGLQWALEAARLMTPMLKTANVWLGAAILVGAGIWQLTPLKTMRLRHCRSPLGFLMNNWRPGRLGALRMGLEHGAYCLGCCWVLMALLFFGGVMNLYWIVGLAIFVLLEKIIPLGHWLGRVAGVVLIGWGAYLPMH